MLNIGVPIQQFVVNPRYYSTLFPEIYRQVLYYTKELMSKSLNDSHRLVRMRARPKILLAKNYEKAKKYFDRYHNNIIGILSDIRFQKSGKVQKSGILFSKYVSSSKPENNPPKCSPVALIISLTFI